MIKSLLSIGLTLYYAYKAKPDKKHIDNYMLYASLMITVAVTNHVLTRLALTGLIPIIEETYKITASKLTPAKNKYIMSGVIFGTVEMASYIITIPTQEMIISRTSVLYIHPTSMLIYSYIKNKVNTVAAFFAAVAYHGLWNLLITMYPWESSTTSWIFITLSTTLAILLTNKTSGVKNTC